MSSKPRSKEELLSLHASYIRLSPFQKKVLDFLIYLRKKYGSVYPSIDTIAEFAGCDRRTVFRALEVLRRQGWLAHENRPYQSNLYYVSDELLAVDFKKPPVTQACHPNVTVLVINKELYNTLHTEASHDGSADVPYSGKEEQKRPPEIKKPSVEADGYPSWLPNLLKIQLFHSSNPKGINCWAHRWLGGLTEGIIHYALEEVKNFMKRCKRDKIPIPNLAGLLISKLKKHANGIVPYKTCTANA